MRLAHSPGPAALVSLLGRIDATRAPLQPLLLQGWVKLFGTSESAGRSFSVACGLLTVAMVDRLARRGFADTRAGLWAAWLAAFSPQLVYYSREVRCTPSSCSSPAWRGTRSFSLRGSATAGRLCWYAVTLAALVYTHPLGLFMAAVGRSRGIDFPASVRDVSWGRWTGAHLAALLAVMPWLGRYFDHPPDFLSGPLPLGFCSGRRSGSSGATSWPSRSSPRSSFTASSASTAGRTGGRGCVENPVAGGMLPHLADASAGRSLRVFVGLASNLRTAALHAVRGPRLSRPRRTGARQAAAACGVDRGRRRGGALRVDVAPAHLRPGRQGRLAIGRRNPRPARSGPRANRCT